MTGRIHFGAVPDGSIVHFPGSAVFFLKTCDGCGIRYGVSLSNNRLYTSKELRETFGDECYIVAADLNELFYGYEED